MSVRLSEAPFDPGKVFFWNAYRSTKDPQLSHADRFKQFKIKRAICETKENHR